MDIGRLSLLITVTFVHETAASAISHQTAARHVRAEGQGSPGIRCAWEASAILDEKQAVGQHFDRKIVSLTY